MKLKIFITLLFALILVFGSYEVKALDGDTNEDITPSPSEQFNPSSGSGSGVTNEGGSVSNSHGNFDISRGTSFDITPSGIRLSHVNHAKIKNKKNGKTAKISNAKNVFIDKDGGITADSADLFEYEKFSVTNVKNLEYTAEEERIEFTEGTNIRTDKDLFQKLKDATFKYENQELTNLKFIFPEKTTYKITNPLSFNLNKVTDTTYRLDTDNDGLSDDFEKLNGLDMNHPDTDSDELTDYEEIMLYPTNPLKADTYTTDTLTSDKELIEQLKADPTILGDIITELGLENNIARDSDGDGISDINEYRYNMDYKRADKDADGFSDGYELTKAMDINSADEEIYVILEECTDCFITIEGEIYSKIEADIVLEPTEENKITFTLTKANLNLGSNFIKSLITNKNLPAVIEIKKISQGYNITTTNEKQIIFSRDSIETLEGNTISHSVGKDVQFHFSN